MENKILENNKKQKLSEGNLIVILLILSGIGLFGAGFGLFLTIYFYYENLERYDAYLLSISLFIIGILIIFGCYKGIKKILDGRKILKALQVKEILKEILKIVSGSIVNVLKYVSGRICDENHTEKNSDINKISIFKIILILVLIGLIGFGVLLAGFGVASIIIPILRGNWFQYEFVIITILLFIVGGLLIFGGYKGIKKILNGRQIVKVLNLCKILKILENIFNKINNIFNKTNNGENNAENKSKKIDY